MSASVICCGPPMLPLPQRDGEVTKGISPVESWYSCLIRVVGCVISFIYIGASTRKKKLTENSKAMLSDPVEAGVTT